VRERELERKRGTEREEVEPRVAAARPPYVRLVRPPYAVVHRCLFILEASGVLNFSCMSVLLVACSVLGVIWAKNLGKGWMRLSYVTVFVWFVVVSILVELACVLGVRFWLRCLHES